MLSRNYHTADLAALRIFLLRHGQTAYNRQHILQGGGIDSVLDAEGHRQAAQFYAAWHMVPFAAVYTSDLQRTQQTMAPFAASGAIIQVHPGLREFHWGELEGRIFDAELQAIYARYLEQWHAGQTDLAIPGGESPSAAWARFRAAVEDIRAEHPAGHVLVCTHGRMLRIALAGLTTGGIQNMGRFKHANTAVNVLKANAQGFELEAHCDTSHLDSVPRIE